MLYDNRWDKQVKADPFTLESLIAWLEKQPEDKGYCFEDSGRCLFSQYFTHCGYKHVHCARDYFREAANTAGKWTEAPVIRFPDGFAKIASRCPRTFGAALERARAALSAINTEQRASATKGE